ncbi:DUF5335 domain-containing protein [Microvirga sp. 2TAF3]|uniref:DUF5335 domain-containing protein n=1 Tax=Microvirga sp. 2TAF3 TaxID=3233014 RepID=UPI003F9AD84E
MSIRKLGKTEWRSFCDLMSKALLGKRAEVLIASHSLGNQVEAKWLPLLGIVYDGKDDMIEVALDGLDHMIRQPSELYVENEATGLTSLQIISADGTQQIITFRDPLMLPSPSR